MVYVTLLFFRVLLNVLEETTTNAHSSIADGSNAQLSREQSFRLGQFCITMFFFNKYVDNVL